MEDLNQKLAYRLSELAQASGLSVPFLRKEARAGRLKIRKVGGAVIVKACDVDEFLNGGEEKGGQGGGEKN